MNNEFMFQACFLAFKKVASQPNHKSYLADNQVFYRYILDGYLAFQYLAIRRLTDSSKNGNKKTGVTSLVRLFNEMKNQLITRKAFVSVDDLPYDYSDLLAKEKHDQLAKMMQMPNGGWLDESGPGAQSAKRHKMFDRLSGVSEQNRGAEDTVSQAYWDECQKLLEDPSIIHIKNVVNKYLAHAADEESEDTLELDDKKFSMGNIHRAQLSLITLVQKLTLDFYDYQFAMVPVWGKEQMVYNFSKPYVPEGIETEILEELDSMLEKQLSSL